MSLSYEEAYADALISILETWVERESDLTEGEAIAVSVNTIHEFYRCQQEEQA